MKNFVIGALVVALAIPVLELVVTTIMGAFVLLVKTTATFTGIPAVLVGLYWVCVFLGGVTYSKMRMDARARDQ